MTSLETLTLEKKGERKSSIERDSRSSVLSHRFLNKCAPLTNFFLSFSLSLALFWGGEISLQNAHQNARARSLDYTTNRYPPSNSSRDFSPRMRSNPQMRLPGTPRSPQTPRRKRKESSPLWRKPWRISRTRCKETRIDRLKSTLLSSSNS